MSPKRIGLIGFEGVAALHLVAPAEAFCAAALDDGYGGRIRCYDVCTIGAEARQFRAESGLQFTAQTTLSEASDFDTVIVAGGSGIRRPQISVAISRWLLQESHGTRRFGTVCTGIFALAPTGLLDGREVTVHWRYATQLRHQFPSLSVNHKTSLTKDGPCYTSSGLAAGLNLALAMIQDDYGTQIATQLRRELVINSTPDVESNTVQQPFDRRPSERFADLVPWIIRNLDGDLSVENLARRACMCPSHFSKAFKSVFGQPPKLFVENLRLHEARRRLSKRQKTVQSVAHSVGFRNQDNFRRAFERRFGTAPATYLSSSSSKARVAAPLVAH